MSIKRLFNRKLTLFAVDILLLSLTAALTYFMLQLMIPGVDLSSFSKTEILSMMAVCIAFCAAGLAAAQTYNDIIIYAALADLIKCVFGICIGSFCAYIVQIALGGLHLEVFFVCFMTFSLVAVSLVRIVYSYIVHRILRKSNAGTTASPSLIVGAGDAGRILLNEMLANCSPEFKPICFVDDDPAKISRSMNGIHIFGPTFLIPALCEKFDIETIFFAIPSCPDDARKRILEICAQTKCKIKTVPSLHEIIMESTMLHQVKDLNFDVFLNRDVSYVANEQTAALVKNRVCLVTGGGGSIGSELCRQIAQYGPSHLIIVDIYENGAYDLQQELLQKYPDLLLSVRIATVRDFKKMDALFDQYKPDIVFHAAAHKHVPLMEDSPEEAVKNNVIGTFYTAMLSDRYCVKKMVLISTDKAVNPTNVMGATKRCCEMVMSYMASFSTQTEFITVRFGNVLGSNGSVIPLFQKQIEAGGPVTVTHPDIIRYFMTIPEAVSLVLSAGAMAQGGEIFVLDMGKPVKITRLAEELIRLYNYEPYVDIQIKFTGLRPGEKLFEELLMDEEGLRSTMNHRIFIGKQLDVDPRSFINELYALKRAAAENDAQAVVDRLCHMVPTFHHNGCDNPYASEDAQFQKETSENAPNNEAPVQDVLPDGTFATI